MVRLLLIASLCLVGFQAKAEILFEGYSKVLAGDEHIGYVVSRYEFDNKKKQFISTYFLKTIGGTDITESLKAYADAELAPLSYEYTSIVGKETKTIDAQFKNGIMKAVVKNGQKIQRLESKIPKGSFLSTFLVYIMLKSKDGLTSEANYKYQAIAEEDASLQEGQAYVGKVESRDGFSVFKVLNTFKNSKFVSYVNDRGEVLGTEAVGQNISTVLVDRKELATQGMPFSKTLLKTIFGNVPEGIRNVKAQAQKLKSEAAPQNPSASKSEGVPQGQGLLIKNTEKGK